MPILISKLKNNFRKGLIAAKCDLTEFPIKIKLATPKVVFDALIEKRIETKKVIVEFEEEG